MSWQTYVLKARLLRAMDLLARPGGRITDVPRQVGFQSPSAFAKAFSQFAAETPCQFTRPRYC